MKSFLRNGMVAFMILTGFLAKAQTITNYTTTDGLPDNFIIGGVAVDNSNNKWFGTAAGLVKYDGSNWTTYTTTDGLIDNYVISVAVDNNGSIWAGTNLGVSKFTGTTWTSYTMADGLPDNTVTYIYGDNANNVWFATGAGLARLNGTTWTTYTTTNGLGGDDIKYITQSPDNVMWVGELGGYSSFSDPTFTTFTNATIDSLVSNNVFAIAVDATGTKWIGTWYGISKISSTNTWIENVRMSDGLYNNFVRDIKIAPNGDIWVGCFADYNGDGGVCYYDVSTSAWTSFSVPQGLADLQVTRLAPDQNGDIWVATGNGVSKISGVNGIGDESDIRFVVYPNPSSDVVEISSPEKPDRIRLMNASGQTIAEVYPESNVTMLPTRDLAKGIYLIQLNIGNKTGIHKCIVE